jgi:hypothetical protein
MALYGADGEKAEKEMYFADRILNDMQHLNVVHLVYDEEKEVVKKALQDYRSKLQSQMY